MVSKNWAPSSTHLLVGGQPNLAVNQSVQEIVTIIWHGIENHRTLLDNQINVRLTIHSHLSQLGKS